MRQIGEWPGISPRERVRLGFANMLIRALVVILGRARVKQILEDERRGGGHG